LKNRRKNVENLRFLFKLQQIIAGKKIVTSFFKKNANFFAESKNRRKCDLGTDLWSGLNSGITYYPKATTVI
jgi:hypothetical protein